MASWRNELVNWIVSRRPDVRLTDDPGSVRRVRRELDRIGGWLRRPRDVEVRPAVDAPVPASWLDPAALEPGRVLVYLHGGGYVCGSPRSHLGLAARIARSARARTLLVDYALAPERPHPAALRDALAVLDWLGAEGFDPATTVLAGDSAGGGLTLATLVRLRELSLPRPAAAVLLSPWLDLTMSGPSMEERRREDPLLDRDVLAGFARCYVGDGDPAAPLVSPLFADLGGLPPMLCQVGSREVLLDDARRLADRARDSGSPLELEVWDGMMHVWHFSAGVVPEGRRAIRRIGRWVDTQLRPEAAR